MEHYWCLRWLLQERIAETTGTVVRDTLVRFDRLPLVVRLADLPALATETRVRIAIGRVDSSPQRSSAATREEAG